MQRLGIVTGANRGIGFEVCRQLARLDYCVLLTSRDAAKGGISAQMLAEEGLPILFHQLDVTDEASIAALRKFVVGKYGCVVNISSTMGQHAQMRDMSAAYRLSKDALNALTQMIANSIHGKDILVNACCPRWVRTEIGGSHATRSLEEGADTIVWLATLPSGGPSGGFFKDKERIEW